MNANEFTPVLAKYSIVGIVILEVCNMIFLGHDGVLLFIIISALSGLAGGNIGWQSHKLFEVAKSCIKR